MKHSEIKAVNVNLAAGANGTDQVVLTLREGGEWLARLAFYAGVPLWLGWRLLAA